MPGRSLALCISRPACWRRPRWWSYTFMSWRRWWEFIAQFRAASLPCPRRDRARIRGMPRAACRRFERQQRGSRAFSGKRYVGNRGCVVALCVCVRGRQTVGRAAARHPLIWMTWLWCVDRPRRILSSIIDTAAVCCRVVHRDVCGIRTRPCMSLSNSTSFFSAKEDMFLTGICLSVSTIIQKNCWRILMIFFRGCGMWPPRAD